MPSGVYVRTAEMYETRRGVPGKQKGSKRTPEQRKRNSESHLGRIPWNKGKKSSVVPWNKGKKTGVVPWNKGLTLSTTLKDRIAKTLIGKRDKASPHSIYYLIDPVTLVPRYVGFSERPEKRFEHHVTQLRGGAHKITWIRSLLNSGLQPILSVRCIVQSKLEACRVETALIVLLKSRGIDLTNATPGGEGGATMTGRKGTAHGAYGTKWTDEQRAAKSALYTPEVRAAHGKAVQAGWAKRNGAPTKRQGKGWSESQRLEITKAKSTPEAIQRSRDAQIGKIATEETRAKMKIGQQRRRTTEASLSPSERLHRQIIRMEKKLARLKSEVPDGHREGQ